MTATKGHEMKAGSLQNMMADGASDAATPELGMGATLVRWTDRHAGTVVYVSPSGHKISVQRDKATRTDTNGMSDAQTYEFEADPNGAVETYTRRKDGTYRQAGGTSRCLLGSRSHYHDFSF